MAATWGLINTWTKLSISLLTCSTCTRFFSKATTLAVKLGCKAVFCDSVMRRCTPYGARDFPGLPTTELAELKEAIWNLFPMYFFVPIKHIYCKQKLQWKHISTSVHNKSALTTEYYQWRKRLQACPIASTHLVQRTSNSCSFFQYSAFYIYSMHG